MTQKELLAEIDRLLDQITDWTQNMGGDGSAAVLLGVVLRLNQIRSKLQIKKAAR